jgi:hypothetical protein
MIRRAALLLLLASGFALADERVAFCFNYGCAEQVEVVFSGAQLAGLRDRLAAARSAADERAILAVELGRLYRWAGEQSPIAADRAGDYLDDGVNGMMDCIDHAQSTHRLLLMLEGQGALRYHRVEAVRRRVRWLVTQHFSAVIGEFGATGAGAQFVVDTWFGEHGDPAVILPLDDWLDGEGPNVS